MKITANLIDEIHGESGMLIFDDGAIAIWGVDEPLAVISPKGELTREWQANRFPSERTPWGLYLDEEIERPLNGHTSKTQQELINRIVGWA